MQKLSKAAGDSIFAASFRMLGFLQTSILYADFKDLLNLEFAQTDKFELTLDNY